jgi:16S rRNA (cytosine1402-N4)-methyltransferase
VNNELEVLERALPALRDRLEDEGVLVVLSYHSLEDRRVKDAFREWSRSCICPPEAIVCQCRGHALGTTLTKKPMLASDDEVAANSRSRSAKLRAWKRVA